MTTDKSDYALTPEAEKLCREETQAFMDHMDDADTLPNDGCNDFIEIAFRAGWRRAYQGCTNAIRAALGPSNERQQMLADIDAADEDD